jgi:ribose transport system ATP-binding protein
MLHPADLRLRMSNIHKSFGRTQALRGVDLELRPGEIHALVGENGAGKSTLVKVLNGVTAPDAGVMTLNGQPYAPRGPHEARCRGVTMVYQELTLAPHLSVEANITLGIEDTRFGFLRPRVNRRKVEEVLAVLQHPEITPDMQVRRLGPAAQQLVEIARALLIDARVLVLDEPTSALNQEDAGRLFTIMRRLRERGVSLIYISHFLEEVQEIADRITILRDGRSVASGAAADFSRDRIIEAMVGRSLTEQFPRVDHVIGEPILELQELAITISTAAVNLTLHRGEILGVFGLVGAGRTELLRAVFGLEPVRSGRVMVRTIAGNRAGTRGTGTRGGLGLLSEDRKQEGLAIAQSIADNLTYSRLRPYATMGVLNLGARRREVRRWLGKIGVRCSSPDQPVGELSGGNQQKVAIGRLLHQEAEVLLLDEPTRGVDVGSKTEIYHLIGELAAQGKGILMVSSYLPELVGVCDRLAVMTRGRLSPIRPAGEWTSEQIMAWATQS